MALPAAGYKFLLYTYFTKESNVCYTKLAKLFVKPTKSLPGDKNLPIANYKL